MMWETVESGFDPASDGHTTCECMCHVSSMNTAVTLRDYVSVCSVLYSFYCECQQ